MKKRFWIDNPMLLDLIIGDLFFLIIGEIIIFIAFKGKLDIMSGYLFGVIISILMLWHMAYAIEDSVRMDEHSALKHIKKNYIFRTIALIVAFFAVWFAGIGNLAAMMFGVLVLKLSAYIQPITNRLTSKLLRKGR